MKEIAVIILIISGISTAGIIYVDTVAVNGDGSLNSPFNQVRSATAQAGAGDTILVKPGRYEEGEITFANNGNAGSPIVLKAFDPGNRPVLRRATSNVMRIDRQYIIVDGFIMDGNFGDNDILRLRSGGDHVIIRNCEVRYAIRDGIDFGSIRDLRIENCEVHHVLAGTFTTQLDAHGITGGSSFDIRIKNCSVHHFSGDAFQIDPGRQDWDSVEINNCEFWIGPLDKAYAGFNSGEHPGENAIDTKVQAGISYRPKLFLRNIVAHGFTNTAYIGNRAAFNLKEGVDAVVDSCTLYDNEIAFRVRGPGSRGGAHVIVINTVTYDNDYAFRAEDLIEELKIYNCTFDNNTRWMQKAGGGYAPQGYEALNNLFLGNVPSDAYHTSNISATTDYFVGSASHNYHLTPTSPALNHPDMAQVPEVVINLAGDTWQNPAALIGAKGPQGSTVKGNSLENRNVQWISVYPNPAVKFFTLKLSKYLTALTLNIYDIGGRNSVNYKFGDGNTFYVPVSELGPGVYYLEVIAGNRKLNKKILIHK
jgi:hypothetical protein